MRSKILVVGMNPSNTLENVRVRKNSTVDRLNQWMNFVGVDHYSFINAVQHRGKVVHKDVDQDMLKSAVKGYKHVVALGGFASGALSSIRVSHFKMPHPSPRNRVLNDKNKEVLYLMALKEYIGGYDGS